MSPDHALSLPIDLLLYSEDPTALARLSRYLPEGHYHFTACSDPAAAEEALGKQTFAVLIFDHPLNEAMELAEKLRQRDPAAEPTPLFFLTDLNFDPAVTALGYQLGSVDFLLRTLTEFGFAGKVRLFADFYLSRRRLEARERMQLRKFEVIFQESPAAMALHRGPHHVFEILNPKYHELLGNRDVVGKTFLEAMPEIADQPFDDLRTRVYQTGIPYVAREMKATFRRSENGPLREGYFDFSYTRVDDADGKPYGVYVHAMEATERVLARQKIEKAEDDQRFRAELGDRLARIPDVESVVGHATEALALRLGASRCFVAEVEDSTHTARVYLDYAKDLPSLRGSHDLMNFGPKLLESWRNDAVVIVGDVKTDDRTVNEAAAHMSIGIRSFISIRILRNGIYIGVVNATSHLPRAWTMQEADLLRSTAETVWSAFENARLYQKANEAIAARDDFLSIASHELKTPVTSLKLQIQILARQLKRNDPNATSVESLQNLTQVAGRQINQLTRLIEDMLDVSRIASGKLNLSLAVCDAYILVQNALASFRPQADSAGVRLIVPQELIAEKPSLPIFCDEQRLEQVLTNLLTNALKYGSGKPIEIQIRNSSDFVYIDVLDSGAGVTDEDKKRIFGRFERAISANEVSGLGLGLYISREIIDGHGGTIEMHDREDGPGSVFTLGLPLASI